MIAQLAIALVLGSSSIGVNAVAGVTTFNDVRAPFYLANAMTLILGAFCSTEPKVPLPAQVGTISWSPMH